jgi:hypothetical protein
MHSSIVASLNLLLHKLSICYMHQQFDLRVFNGVYIELCWKQVISHFLSTYMTRSGAIYFGLSGIFVIPLKSASSHQVEVVTQARCIFYFKRLVRTIITFQNNSVFVLDIFFYSSSKSGCTMQAKAHYAPQSTSWLSIFPPA